jgi:hypothetical protein
VHRDPADLQGPLDAVDHEIDAVLQAAEVLEAA